MVFYFRVLPCGKDYDLDEMAEKYKSQGIENLNSVMMFIGCPRLISFV